MQAPEFLEFDEVISRALGDLHGVRIVDIGAGSGSVTRTLASHGADIIGVEPNADQVGRAVAEGGGARYVTATAEATGLPDEECDLALFSRSLHHIEDMPAALREAGRITRKGGRIAVIEPIAPDPIYPVMRYIDDESEVYIKAQQALDDAVAAGALHRVRTLCFSGRYRVDSAEAMIANLITVDSDRRLADADRPAFEAAFAAAQRHDEQGGYIPDWSRIDVFTRL